MKKNIEAILKSKNMKFEADKNYYYMAKLNLLEVESINLNLTIRTNDKIEKNLELLFYVQSRRENNL